MWLKVKDRGNTENHSLCSFEAVVFFMNKKKIIFAIILFTLSFIIQIISFTIFKEVDTNTFCIAAISSAIPFSSFLFIISSLFDKRFKILKYIFIIYGILVLLAFVIIIIIATTTGFVISGNQFVMAG